MKVKITFLIITIFQAFRISCNYSFEPIEELIPKTAIFETSDFNSYKIYRYIPSCSGTNISNKNIYIQILGGSQYPFIYVFFYDNYEKIAQDKNSLFINFIGEMNYISNFDFENSILFSDLNCNQEYYIVISNTHTRPDTIVSSFIVNVIDADIGNITLSPELSDIFSFHKRKDKEEIILYSFNETKYGLFSFSTKAQVKIFKNNELFYNKEDEPKKVLLLEKNENYTIYFNSENQNFFSLQLFNEPPDFKYDYKSGPIALYYSTYYYLEIDISEYKLDDIILFSFFTSESCAFRYQYKKNFKGNNFIDLGSYSNRNFIPIKKTIEDSTLIIRIQVLLRLQFSILSIIQDKIEEIKTEYNQIITGPKYFFIDYFDLNNINSIGIGANESFNIFEEKKEYSTSISFRGYQNYYITKNDNNAINIFKSALIYFNSTNKILFEVKKFNYPTFISYTSNLMPDFNSEFFQLCQGHNTLNELHFYLLGDILILELFNPVFGAFDSYFIKEDDIKNLSDYDYDKIQTPNFFNLNQDLEPGYLKIKCKEPLMLKHSFIYSFDNNNFNAGQKYYLHINNGMTLNFNNSLINKNIQLKITIFGLEPNQSIALIINNNTYDLNNKPFYLDFKYEKDMTNFSYFKIGETIDNLLAEIIVGYLPEQLNETFKQIDFIDSLGTLNLKEKEGVIIKIPRKFTEDLYDSSIIIPGYYNNSAYTNDVYFDITYDKLEFQTMWYNKKKIKMSSPAIPLFSLNPYDKIGNELDENKFFYVLIYCNYNSKIYIRKPKLYDIKFNTINYFPQLNESNKDYYYRIKIPEQEGNNNFVSVQVAKDIVPMRVIFSNNNIQYSFTNQFDQYRYFYYYNLPYDKRNKNNYAFINYYFDDTPGTINFIDRNEQIPLYPIYDSVTKFIKSVEQIEEKNKLKFEFESLSYIFYPKLLKYYLIFNVGKDFNNFYPIITGYKELNKTDHQFMVIVEDDGLNETFTKEIDINIDLIEEKKGYNNVSFIPIMNDTNIIKDSFITYKDFKFKNISKNKNKTKTLLIILIPIIIIIIILAVILYLRYRRKKNDKDISVNKVLEENLVEIDS